MNTETVELKVDYSAAGVSSEGCYATLDCYTNTYNAEMGKRAHRAVLICPGGGYDYCSERVAVPVALRLLRLGIYCSML